MVGPQTSHSRPRLALATAEELDRWQALEISLAKAEAEVIARKVVLKGVPRNATVMARAAFLRLPHVEQLERCQRPEHLDGPSPEAWCEINAHLGTTAASLPQLVEQLGQRTFGHTPRVGDAFCGGGSIPFEAARIGCAAFGSDLNPVAGLLTWAALHLLGGGLVVQAEVMRVQAAARTRRGRPTSHRVGHRAQRPQRTRRRPPLLR